MTIKKFAYTSTLVGLSSLLALGSLTPAVLAKTTAVPSIKSEQGSHTLRQGLPGRRLGGGTRQDGQVFTAEYAYLAALTTSDNLSITTAERPTFMYYIPDMVSEQTGELIIRDQNDNLVYKNTFPINSEGSIVRFNTADDETMPALALNETYQWFFSIIPDIEERASDIAVSGNIRRVQQEEWLTEHAVDSEVMAAANPIMQARMLYQQADLWHDAALMLDELRQANPTDTEIAAEWDQLIAYVGLTAVIELPEPTVHIGLN